MGSRRMRAFLSLRVWPCRRCKTNQPHFVRRRYLGVCCGMRIFHEALDEFMAELPEGDAFTL